MKTSSKIQSLTAAALCAAAVVPGAAGAAVERGDYFGKTEQPAATKYTGSVRVDLGIISNPPRVVRVELKARLRCADGSTRDARYGKVIAFGPQLSGKGRFSYVDGGLSFQGKIGTKGKARGTFAYTVDDCSIAGVKWSAKVDD